MMQTVLTLITLVSLLFWPLATLLWLQMAILPYHSPDLLAVQRTALVIDVVLVAWLWPKTMDAGDSSWQWWKRGFAIFMDWGKLWQARRDCHKNTDNIPGRDVIRGLPYGTFIVRGIDTHRHECWALTPAPTVGRMPGMCIPVP